MAGPLVDIRDLRVLFHGDDGRTTHAVDAVDLFRQTHAEIASAQRPKRADEMAAIDEFPRGLDVHWFTPVSRLPPPVVEQRRPPSRRTNDI
jgi:hypothetical protein